MKKKPILYLLSSVVIASLLLGVFGCGNTSSDIIQAADEKIEDIGKGLDALKEETENTKDNLQKEIEVEKTKGKLPGGIYIVGEDISAGKYDFTYTTKMSKDDYWENDYFYITRSGSEGENETLGGTKYDERFGSVDYKAAKKGKNFFANLKDGDKIEVNSDFGTWSYKGDIVASKAISVKNNGKELSAGTYTVGEDIKDGKYLLKYITTMSKSDYWGNDYLYVTRSGSKGTNETLGGTKFDERFGSVEYRAAKKGKSFYVNLKSGDKITVNSDFGTWTY